MSELTLDELSSQLCQLEAALEIRIGDLPASQIIRAATRRLELLRRDLEEERSEHRATISEYACYRARHPQAADQTAAANMDPHALVLKP